MTGTWAIIKRELYSYYTSPVAYVVMTVFLFIVGIFFYGLMKYFSEVSFQYASSPYAFEQAGFNPNWVLREMLQSMTTIVLFISPLLTMRLLAEEKRSKTDELLFTCPISLTGVVLGKFLASLLFFSIMVGLTIYAPIILLAYAGKAGLEFGPVFSGYLGVILLGGSFLALGMFASSLTENQIIAAILSFGIILFLWLIDMFTEGSFSPFSQVLNYLSIMSHVNSFLTGVIDLKDIVFYLSVITFGLFLTHRVLESSRWK